MSGTSKLLCMICCVLLAVLLVIGACIFFSPKPRGVVLPTEEPKTSISVHFLDVGQGDAAVVQTPAGNMIIDTGTLDSRDTLIAYIDELEIETFTYMVLTHPHGDHIGGAKKILQNYTVENVVMPDAVNNSFTFEKMVVAIEEEKCNLIAGEAGMSFALGEVSIDLLAPVYEDDSNLNNMSIVTRITYGDISFLLAGDAEIESESAMLMTNEAALDADILKLGHHGSSTSSSVDFLQAVSPEVAIASCGYNNDYGHPHREVVQRLREMGIPLYRTYETGTIVFSTDGTEYTMQTKK